MILWGRDILLCMSMTMKLLASASKKEMRCNYVVKESALNKGKGSCISNCMSGIHQRA